MPANGRLRHRRVFDNADERKVAVTACRVEAVTNHEVIRHDKARVFDLEFFLDPRFRLVQKTRECDGPSSAGPEDIQQPRKRKAGVDNILDDQHVLVTDRIAEILDDLDVAARDSAVLVARDRHEIDRERKIDGTHQVGQKHARSLEHADQDEILALIVAADLGTHFLDPLSYLLGGKQDFEVRVRKFSMIHSGRFGGHIFLANLIEKVFTNTIQT